MPGGSKPVLARGAIIVKASAAQLAQAPRLAPDKLAALEKPCMRGDIYGYYGYAYRPYGRNALGYDCGWGYAPGPAGVPGTVAAAVAERVRTDQSAQLYRHFGITPYWEQGAAQIGSNWGNSASGPGPSSGSSRQPATSK